jgi:hypothetical protein
VDHQDRTAKGLPPQGKLSLSEEDASAGSPPARIVPCFPPLLRVVFTFQRFGDDQRGYRNCEVV